MKVNEKKANENNVNQIEAGNLNNELNLVFKKMMVELDFMSIVLYPTLNNRK
jgi:hypothetical protein